MGGVRGLLVLLAAGLVPTLAIAQDAPAGAEATEVAPAEAPPAEAPPTYEDRPYDEEARTAPPAVTVEVSAMGAPAPYVSAEPVIEVPPAPPVRIVGFGTALGGGIAVGGVYTPGGGSGFSYVAPAIELPSLEALFFVDDHFSIDLSIPVLNTAILGGLGGYFAWATNITFDFSIGDDWVRFVVGPAIGFSVVSAGSYSGGQINLGALVGLELLSRGRSFGFRVMTRPQLQIAFAGSSGGLGGNALLEVAFVGYFAQ